MSSVRKLAVIAVFALSATLWNGVFAQDLSVVVDPAFGGKVRGPHLQGEVFGKHLTLQIGRGVAEELHKNGVPVKLTRDSDEFVPYDQSLLRIEKMNIRPTSYVLISVGSSPGSCLRILHPKAATTTRHRNKGDVGDVMRTIGEEQYWNDSKALAGLITDELKKLSPKPCVKLAALASYRDGGRVNVLPTFFLAPVVIVELEKDLARTLTTRDGTSFANTSTAVASAVSAYLRDRFKRR